MKGSDTKFPEGHPANGRPVPGPAPVRSGKK